jgi:hypothetical protein
MRALSIRAAAVLALFAASAAQAATVSFTATLKGASEVPANTSVGTGYLTGTVDTGMKLFGYTVTYSGLSGPPTAAHFHGAAAPGVNAPPIITITKLASPIEGTAKLTDAQIAELVSGQWYFNIHTAAHPSGEIRGQLIKAP